MSDTIFLSGKDIFTETKRLFESEEAIRIKCAVAFWGKGSLEILRNCHKPVQIICNLENGGTNPSVIRGLQKRKNIQIRSHRRIHAKVYLSKEHMAIVGSSNMSSNGLSLESEELEGWIEANVLIPTPELLTIIEIWFDDLWKDSSPINEYQLKMAEILWQKRRKQRPPFKSITRKSSLLKTLHDNRELLKDRKIFILLCRDETSSEANETFKLVRKANRTLRDMRLDFFENWDDLPDDAYLIDLHYDRNSPRSNSFKGLFRIQDRPYTHKFQYKNRKRGFITLCNKIDSIELDALSLELEKDDKRILKRKIEVLWDSSLAKGDDAGKIISLYDAWAVLFE